MNNQSLEKFLTTKKELEKEGFKFIFMFELTYYNELKESYDRRLVDLGSSSEAEDPVKMRKFLRKTDPHKKIQDYKLTGFQVIHYASSDGFSEADFLHTDRVHSEETTSEKSEKFCASFQKLVEQLNHSKTCVIMTDEKHHLAQSVPSKVPVNQKKRELASRVSVFLAT